MKIQKSKICIVLAISVFLISGTVFCREDILPSAPKDLYSHAKMAHGNKDYKTALKLFRKLQKEFPYSENSVRTWEYIAQCENQLGNQFAAFEAYQQIWNNHKDFGRLSVITRNQMQIGNYYLNVKRYKFAIEIYQQILENAPFSESAPAAQFSLAEAYIGLEDYYSAKHELKKVIEDYPSSQLVDDAAYKLGYVNFLESEGLEYDQTATEDAVVYFRRFIHNFPSSPKVADARKYIKLLRERIAASIFRKGEFYYNIRASKAANIQFKSVINRYPDTKYADLSREFLLGIKTDSGEAIVAKKPSKVKSFAPQKEKRKIDKYDRPYTDYKKRKEHQRLAQRKESRKNQKIKELLNKVGKEELHEYVKTTYYIPEIKSSRLMASEWEKQKTLLAELSTKKSDVKQLEPIAEKAELEETFEAEEKLVKEKTSPLVEKSSEVIEKPEAHEEKVVESGLESPSTEEKSEEAEELFSSEDIWGEAKPEKLTEENKIEENEQNNELAEQVEEIITDSLIVDKKDSESEEEGLLEENIGIQLKEVKIPKPKSEIKSEDKTFEPPVIKTKDEERETEVVEPKTEDGEPKTEDGEPKTEDGEPKTEDGEQKTAEVTEEKSTGGWKTRKISGAGKVKRAQYEEPAAFEGEITHEMLLREFKSAYDYIQKGDATRQKGLYLKAKTFYEKALNKYIDIQKKSPKWETKLINYRINYCRETLRGIE